MATKIQDINKMFGDFQALYGINVEIQDGEFVAILGPSGCGKTTLLRILAGFEQPTSGQIMINDTIVSDAKKTLPPEKRNIAMVFQSFALWPHMTVREHIKFPLLHDPFVSADVRQYPDERVNHVIKSVGLDQMADRLPGQLSGGQKQRVALGRAIAPEPKLLLMDEPLSSLDAELRMEMRREIQQLHRMTNASIMYVTHDQGEALAMADHIIVMKAGRIEQIGTPQEIYYHPETEFVANFVSKANIIEGKWEGDQFIIDQSNVRWSNSEISKSIKIQGKYYVRPEDIILREAQEGQLQGTIQTGQFQGKEYHYSVELDNGQILIVHAPFTDAYSVGQRISIIPKQAG